MALIKTPVQLETMRQCGAKLAQVRRELVDMIDIGITTQELDNYAEKRMKELSGRPSFKEYAPSGENPFPATLCTSINNELVHCMPSDRKLEEGDILSMDMGMWLKGEDDIEMCTDHAVTVGVGAISDEAQKLIDVTKKSLDLGMAVVKDGANIVEIGRAVQEYSEGEGFAVIRDLVGHGVGHEVHEDPRIPNFVSGKPAMDLQEGMCIAIEPMLAAGSYGIEVGDNGWDILMADGSLSAHFEHTMIVTKDGLEIVTD